MTFEQLDAKLPNGFHDAKLYGIATDYVTGSIVLHMALDFGDPNGTKPDDYRIGQVRVTGLYFCAIAPPDPKCRYVPHGFPLDVSGDPAMSDTLPALEDLAQTIPPEVSCYRFFVHQWNSFIHLAARDVEVTWIEEGTTAPAATS